MSPHTSSKQDSATKSGKVDGGGQAGKGSDFCLTNDGVDCNGNQDCETCINDGECASGYDPVWWVAMCKCVCFDDPSQLGCQVVPLLPRRASVGRPEL